MCGNVITTAKEGLIVNYNLLVIDDDEYIAKSVRINLEADNYKVDICSNGQEALKKIDDHIYNILILDTAVSGLDGLTLLLKIRERSYIPVILISDKPGGEDKIKGFALGADDYIPKPLDMEELKARVRALVRRTYEYVSNKNEIIHARDIVIDVPSRKVNVSGKHVELTSKEFDILFLLVTNPGKIYNRETLLEIIWGYDYYGDSRTVDVHVRRLREKIERDPANPQYIMTKWGVGYYYKG
jgi:DNA-binding response OmpR family regulator